MKTIIITDEANEYLEFKGDEERSALIQRTRGKFPNLQNERVIILNPKQEQKLKNAIAKIQKERAKALNSYWT